MAQQISTYSLTPPTFKLHELLDERNFLFSDHMTLWISRQERLAQYLLEISTIIAFVLAPLLSYITPCWATVQL